MSAYNDIDVTCKDCGDDFRAAVWTAVHAGEDPELKELILGGELNIAVCSFCGSAAYQDGFLLYQEPALELIAYVHPANLKAEEDNLRAFMVQGFREAQALSDLKQRLSYDPILLFGLDALVEVLTIEEERTQQSDIAKTLCKKAGIHTHLIPPAKARTLNMPRILPHAGTDSNISRTAVLSGLDRLLKLNPALSLYSDLKKRIYSNTAWHLH